MSVYCDECNEPGSPNDEKGYTESGGWLCDRHRKEKALDVEELLDEMERVAPEK